MLIYVSLRSPSRPVCSKTPRFAYRHNGNRLQSTFPVAIRTTQHHKCSNVHLLIIHVTLEHLHVWCADGITIETFMEQVPWGDVS